MATVKAPYNDGDIIYQKESDGTEYYGFFMHFDSKALRGFNSVHTLQMSEWRRLGKTYDKPEKSTYDNTIQLYLRLEISQSGHVKIEDASDSVYQSTNHTTRLADEKEIKFYNSLLEKLNLFYNEDFEIFYNNKLIADEFLRRDTGCIEYQINPDTDCDVEYTYQSGDYLIEKHGNQWFFMIYKRTLNNKVADCYFKVLLEARMSKGDIVLRELNRFAAPTNASLIVYMDRYSEVKNLFPCNDEERDILDQFIVGHRFNWDSEKKELTRVIEP